MKNELIVINFFGNLSNLNHPGRLDDRGLIGIWKSKNTFKTNRSVTEICGREELLSVHENMKSIEQHQVSTFTSTTKFFNFHKIDCIFFYS